MSEALLPEEQAEILDLVDSLRQHKIRDLPQLIVCGNQSSGKSSLLEALSTIRFSVGGGQCTRFPIEVILRRGSLESATVTIEAAPGTEADRRARFEKLCKTKIDPKDLPEIIEMASKLMGIDSKHPIREDVLRIELTGPTNPDLTLIDLPGLIHATRDNESPGSINAIKNLVNKYMSAPRSIILAVVSAENDYQVQSILSQVQGEADFRCRSMGIITKPDLASDPARQAEFIELAKNKLNRMDYGWHVVKNANHKEREAPGFDRDVEEEAFLASGPWEALPKEQKGISMLKKRLSKCLRGHIHKHISEVLKEIESEHSSCRAKLEKLGPGRTSFLEQDQYLRRCASNFKTQMQLAVDGRYKGKFFSENRCRLQANLRFLNDQLAGSIRTFGLSFIIDDNTDERYKELNRDVERLQDQYSKHKGKLLSKLEDHVFNRPTTISFLGFARDVAEPRLADRRGFHLATTFHPDVVEELVQYQSQHWGKIVRHFADAIFAETTAFVDALVLDVCCDQQSADLIRAHLIQDRLDRQRVEFLEKTEEILASFLDSGALSWNEALENELKINHVEYVNYASQENRVQTEETDFLSAQLITLHVRKYQSYIEPTFLDALSRIAIQHCLIRKLPTLLEAEHLSGLSPDMMSKIAGEDEKVVKEREDLTRLNTELSAAVTKLDAWLLKAKNPIC